MKFYRLLGHLKKKEKEKLEKIKMLGMLMYTQTPQYLTPLLLYKVKALKKFLSHKLLIAKQFKKRKEGVKIAKMKKKSLKKIKTKGEVLLLGRQ